MKRRLITIITLLLITFNITITAASILGPWKGVLNTGASQLNIVFRFSTDNFGNNQCTLDSPDQNAFNIPANIEYISDDSISVNIPNLGVEYYGTIDGDTIMGTFSQSGYNVSLTLRRGDVEYSRPQTPIPPFEYTEEEVTFSNIEDNATLSGTLTYPIGYSSRKNTPVVLLITGSGLQNRDEEIFAHRPFAVIADYLARNGIASLRYDDRGIGKSIGDISNTTSYNNMKDAEAGIKYLRALQQFKSIGIIGHSEGGMIACMLASNGMADFIITLAGTGVRGDSILVSQNELILKQLKIYPDSIVDNYCNTLSQIYELKVSAYNANRQIDITSAILKISNAEIPDEAKKNLMSLLNASNPWFNYFISYSPVEDIRNIYCPAMILNGSKDCQVISSLNLEAFRNNLPKNNKNVIKEYTGLNHLFQHCSTGSVNEYVKIEETISPEVLDDIAEWIKGL